MGRAARNNPDEVAMKVREGLVSQTIFNKGPTFSRAFNRSRHVRSGAGSEPREPKKVGPVLTSAAPHVHCNAFRVFYPEASRNKSSRRGFCFAIS